MYKDKELQKLLDEGQMVNVAKKERVYSTQLISYNGMIWLFC